MKYVVAVIALFTLLFSVPQISNASDISSLQQRLESRIKSFPAEVGVCMISDCGDTISFNEDKQ